jgi:aryl-alcohol dehydrogenase-like predicted oxidoreductase
MSHSFRSRVSRRAVIQAGLAAGAAALFPRFGTAAPIEPLITKAIPSTGERLPAVGLGTDKFGRGEADAIRAEIKRMTELGGTLIDTSSDYGDSEAVIGESLQALGIRNRIFLSTKLTAGGRFFGGVGGKASFDRSLELLRTKSVDLLEVHNLDGTDELMPMMREWKRAGLIRYLGVTTSVVRQHQELMAAMRKHPLDFIQVDYSIGDREAARDVLPLARERKMAVLVNVPFGYGSLFSRVRSKPLPDWAADLGISSWAQYMLKYVISHPDVTCAIPGSTQVDHLVDNQAAGRGRLPDETTRRRMEQYWDKAVA